MRCIRYPVSVLLLTGLSITGLSAQQIDESFDVAKGKTLILDLEQVRGDVTIEGWDQDRVTIQGDINGRGWDDEGLEIRERSSGIVVESRVGRRDRDWFRVRLEIKVPSQFDLRIETATDVEIRNVNGHIEGRIANARIELEQCQGTIDLSSANGRITLVDCNLKGTIDNVNGGLRARNTNLAGHIESVNGSLDLGRAQGGLEVDIVNGSVDLEQATEFVRFKSTNGSIEIDALDGWFEARTVNGSVTLTMVGNPEQGKKDIMVETLNGHVELILPANFAMEVDIEVKRKGHENGFYRIVSDFEGIEIEEFDLWRNGLLAAATGKVGSGRNRVRIRATNGDVYLRRAR